MAPLVAYLAVGTIIYTAAMWILEDVTHHPSMLSRLGAAALFVVFWPLMLVLALGDD